MHLKLSSLGTKTHPKLRMPPARLVRRPVKTSASLQPYEAVGHSIVYFTMFYCGMNWWHYRSIRKHLERLKESEDASDEKDPKN